MKLSSLSSLLRFVKKSEDIRPNIPLIYDITDKVFAELAPEAKAKTNTWFNTHESVVDNKKVVMDCVAVELDHFPKQKDIADYANKINKLSGLIGFVTRVFVEKKSNNKYYISCCPMVFASLSRKTEE